MVPRESHVKAFRFWFTQMHNLVCLPVSAGATHVLQDLVLHCICFLVIVSGKALVRMYCICLVLFMLLPATNAVCAYWTFVVSGTSVGGVRGYGAAAQRLR